MASDRTPRAGGFILAVVLWLLAAVAVSTLLVSAWSLDRVRDATAQRADLEARMTMLGTRDTLLYMLSTHGMSMAGLPIEPWPEDQVAIARFDEFGATRAGDPRGGELAVDGSVYAGLSGVRFAIQDESGLIPLTWPRDATLDAFLVAHGVERERAALYRDKLLDYVDSDQLTRLNGAERAEYERAGLPPPPDRRLIRVSELVRVLDWHALDSTTLERMIDHITINYAGALNLNTAPPALLPIYIPGCPDTCQQVEAMRARAPFRSGFDLQARIGVLLSGDAALDYRFQPSDQLRLSLWSQAGKVWRIHVALTPLADRSAPWRIAATYTVKRPDSDEPPRSTQSALFADPASD